MTEINPAKSPEMIELPGNISESGELRFWDNEALFPKGIQRCFWISKVKPGETRGNHAHLKESQVIVAISGELQVEVTDIEGSVMNFTLNSSSKGLFVPPLHWISVCFGKEAILLALCDRKYSEEDYIRDKKDFDNYTKANR